MSRSHGVGQPLFFRCSKCRRAHSWRERHTRSDRAGAIDRVQLTGERRYRPNHNGGRVDVFWQYQYQCNDCGFVGWSRHIDIARRYADQPAFYVHLVEDATGKTEKRTGPYPLRKAEKIADGLSINLNHAKYSVFVMRGADGETTQ